MKKGLAKKCKHCGDDMAECCCFMQFHHYDGMALVVSQEVEL